MTIKDFSSLHQQPTALLIANVWDVPSAIAAKELGFKAIGTSSAAIASMLGYQDGENMPFEDLLFIVKRIREATNLPLSVDIESGYSTKPDEVVNNINQLVACGVVGINVEDSYVSENRNLKDEHEFANFLSSIKHSLHEKGIQLFINVRTDTYICGVPNTLEQTIKRAKLYQSVGADGIFVPCITNNTEISLLTQAVSLPINVMCMPELSDFESLSNLGVKRISMGNFVFDQQQVGLKKTLSHILEVNSFSPIFN